jgi:transcriptional regulator with XRE-family HTH domain
VAGWHVAPPSGLQIRRSVRILSPVDQATTPNAAIAAEIRAEAGRQRMSGRELARRVGKPDTTIARWLRAETTMDLNEVDAIARALGMSTVELIARALAPALSLAATASDGLPRRDSNAEPADLLLLPLTRGNRRRGHFFAQRYRSRHAA